MEYLEDFPKAVYKPISHGKWVKEKHSTMIVYNPIWDLNTTKYRCSACDRLSLLHEGYKTPYCPWCGADMGESEDGDT